MTTPAQRSILQQDITRLIAQSGQPQLGGHTGAPVRTPGLASATNMPLDHCAGPVRGPIRLQCTAREGVWHLPSLASAAAEGAQA